MTEAQSCQQEGVRETVHILVVQEAESQRPVPGDLLPPARHHL